MKKLFYIFLFIIFTFLCFVVFSPEVNAFTNSLGEFKDFKDSNINTTENLDDFYYMVIYDKYAGSKDKYLIYFFPKEYFSPLDFSGYRLDGYLFMSFNNHNDFVIQYYLKYYYEKGTNNFDCSYSYSSSISISTKGKADFGAYGFDFQLLYSNVDILDSSNGGFIYKAAQDYSIELSTTEITIENIFAYTNWFDIEDINNYIVTVSTDEEHFLEMQIEYELTANEEETKFRYYYEISQNGTYYFKFYDVLKDSFEIITKEVTNITNLIEQRYNVTLDITFEPSTSTTEPIYAKTNNFPPINDVSVLISEDGRNWREMAFDNDSGSMWFLTRIVKNGTYYFKFRDYLRDENGELIYNPMQYNEIIITKVVDWIDIGEYFNEEYVPTPEIQLDYNEDSSSFVIRTQSIYSVKATNLKAYYIESSNYTEDLSEWNEMDIAFETYYINSISSEKDVYFYFEIPVINAVDKNYKIVLFNYSSKVRSNIVDYRFVYDEAIDYVENELDIHLGITVALNELLRSVEDKIGILGLPITVVRQFVLRILLLDGSVEPTIVIPELKEPFYHHTIYEGTTFNFNSILVSNASIFLHEFYLLTVNMVLVYLFLRYLVKTLKAVFEFWTNPNGE